MVGGGGYRRQQHVLLLVDCIRTRHSLHATKAPLRVELIAGAHSNLRGQRRRWLLLLLLLPRLRLLWRLLLLLLLRRRRQRGRRYFCLLFVFLRISLSYKENPLARNCS